MNIGELRKRATSLIGQGCGNSAWLTPRQAMPLLDMLVEIERDSAPWHDGIEPTEDECVLSFGETLEAVNDLRRAVAQRRVPLAVARLIAKLAYRWKALERARRSAEQAR